MKLNKVCTNLNQDFTEEEQTTARNNIRAASSEQVTKLNGAVSNLNNRVNSLEQQLAQDEFDIYQQLLQSNEGNTTLLDKNYIGNDYKEYAGNIGFTTTSSGNMSICAFNANEQLIYPTQCVNFSGPFTGGVTNFIPFTFKEEPNKERISYIGIKGASNGNAVITHLFYIGKK